MKSDKKGIWGITSHFGLGEAFYFESSAEFNYPEKEQRSGCGGKANADREGGP